MPGGRRRASFSAGPCSGPAPGPSRGQPGQVLLEPLGSPERREVVGHSRTSSASFPWVPWAAPGGRETARPTYFKHPCNGLWPMEG